MQLFDISTIRLLLQRDTIVGTWSSAFVSIFICVLFDLFELQAKQHENNDKLRLQQQHHHAK